jgi:hypothetical protein
MNLDDSLRELVTRLEQLLEQRQTLVEDIARSEEPRSPGRAETLTALWEQLEILVREQEQLLGQLEALLPPAEPPDLMLEATELDR